MDPRKISEEISQSWLLRLCYSRNPRQCALFTIPMCLVFLGIGLYGSHRPLLCLGLFLLGPIYWSFLEYVIHRFAYHWKPKSKKAAKIFYRIHQHHHDLPNDYTILNAGPIFGITNAVIVYFLTSALVGSYWIAASLMSGGSLGYLFYEWVHYEAHAGDHKKGWMGYLKRYHLTHHFLAPNACFGVTSPFWDKVFRTELKTQSRVSPSGSAG